MTTNNNYAKSCQLRLECLEKYARIQLDRLYEKSSLFEIDCQIYTYLSCNFDPFEYLNSSTSSSSSKRRFKRNNYHLMKNVNRFLDDISFRWYDHYGLLIPNYLRPTHFMIKYDHMLNQSLLVLINRLGNYYPHKYVNLTCMAQIESSSNHHDEYQSWIDSASLLELANDNAKYIKFEDDQQQRGVDFVSCQLELARAETLWLESSMFLFLIWIILVLILFYFMIRSFKPPSDTKEEEDDEETVEIRRLVDKPKIILNTNELSLSDDDDLVDSNMTQKETINLNSTNNTTMNST